MSKKEPIRVILARMEANQNNLKEKLVVHIRHHWAASLVLLTSTLSLLSAIVIKLMFAT